MLVPLAAAALLLVAPAGRNVWTRWVLASCGGVELLICLFVLAVCVPDGGVQFALHQVWIPSLGIAFYLGVDGLSATLLPVVALVFMAALYCVRGRGEGIALLLVFSAVMGALVARDFFLFYFCSEAAIFPLFMLALLRGGRARERVIWGFAVHMLVSGALLLLVVVGLIHHQRQMGLMPVLAVEKLIAISWPIEFQYWLLLCCALAFVLRLGLVPWHAWAAAWHGAVAPAATLVVAGAWLPLGAYGLLRFALPICIDALRATQGICFFVLAAGATGAALLALAERNPLRQLAHFASCQLAWVVLGGICLSSAGFEGAVVLLVGYSLTMTALFLLLSRAEGERCPVALGAPWARRAALLALLAAAGMPGLGLFSGQFLIALAAFSRWQWWGGIVLLSSLLCAVWALRLFFTVVRERGDELAWGRYAVLAPLLLGSCLVGFYPDFAVRRAGAVAREVMAITVGEEAASQGVISVENEPGQSAVRSAVPVQSADGGDTTAAQSGVP
jgi:NADH-quinone oxidoreductase subunit M